MFFLYDMPFGARRVSETKIDSMKRNHLFAQEKNKHWK